MLRDLDAAAMGQALLQQARAQVQRAPGFRAMAPTGQAAALRLFDLLDGNDLARGLLDGQLLGRAEAALQRDFAERPLLAAQLREALAEVQAGLGLAAGAAERYAAVADARALQLGAQARPTLQARIRQLANQLAAGQRDAALAQLPALRDAVAGGLAADDPLRLEAAMVQAEALAQRGDFAAALAELDGLEAALVAATPALRLRVASQRAGLLLREGRREEARERLDAAIAAAEAQLDAGDQALLDGLAAAVPVRAGGGDLAGALALSERLHAQAAARLGHEHPFTLTQANSRAVTLVNLGRFEEAIPLLRDLVEARTRVIGARHPLTLRSAANLASALARSVQDAPPGATRTARLDEAVGLLRTVLAAREDLLGSAHPDTLLSRASLGSVLLRAGQPAQARPLVEAVLATRLARQGADHREVADVRDLLGEVLLALGDLAGGRRELGLALAGRAAALGAQAEPTLSSALSLYAVLPATDPQRNEVFRRYLAPLLAQPPEAWPAGLRERLAALRALPQHRAAGPGGG
jgi:eukaryotic-like serine/threonine-protein kinase